MQQDPISIDLFTGVSRLEDAFSHTSSFVGHDVVDYDPEQPAPSGSVYRFRSDWDGKSAEADLVHFLATEAAPETTALVIGAWQGDDSSRPPDGVIEILVKNKDRLTQLSALFLGDIVSEENEMSWIHQSDLSPLLQAFPQLQLLRARGGNDLALSAPESQSLRGLILETGGMDASVVRSLGTAKFPHLEHLELWLGEEEYGASCSVEDLRPILLGEAFPNLKYLGLRNSEMTDELAQALLDSLLVQKIETLDLSLGTLSDQGAEALLQLKSPTLKRLNLHYHYLSDDMVKRLAGLAFQVDTSGDNHPDVREDDRYVAVGE